MIILPLTFYNLNYTTSDKKMYIQGIIHPMNEPQIGVPPHPQPWPTDSRNLLPTGCRKDQNQKVIEIV